MLPSKTQKLLDSFTIVMGIVALGMMFIILLK